MEGIKKMEKKKRKLNDQWEFAKFPVGLGWEEIKKGDSAFTPIKLPHDWQIFDPTDLYESAEGWYRRKLTLQTAKGERILLYFEGVYMDTTLYVNGQIAGEWKYGYTSFWFDITEYLKQGENELLVRTVYQHPNTRWYSGAGIYRNVWLYQVPEVHFEPDGVYLNTQPVKKEAKEEQTGSWELRIQAKLRCLNKKVLVSFCQKPNAAIRVFLKDGAQIVRQEDFSLSELSEEGIWQATLLVENPKLWSDQTPNCYLVELQLLDGEKEMDSICNLFGFREFVFDPAKGFFVNGVYTKMKGVCLHHDLGALGAAFHEKALLRQLRIMRKMGANAIRTSHNPPAPKLLEFADQMGFFVIDEAFDMWERSKTEYDYARFFKEWSKKDIANWVCRDRNHPCIVMWSIGNEILDTHADEHGQEITRYLMEEVRKHDPLCNAQVTIGSNYMMSENGQKCADIVKMAGYNYAARFYSKHHEKYPDWCIYGSETCSTVQSRGIYHFPLKQAILVDEDEQCSSLGNSTTSWGAGKIDQIIWEEREHPYSLGQFLWTGFDYIGEPTPYHTKNSYFGMVDTAGFPKDAFYVMQAGWLDVKEHPMIHLYPYWDFNPGQLIDLRVCSNASQVELFFQPLTLQEIATEKKKELGRSLGKRQIDQKHGKSVHADWQLAYEPGILTAVAYDEEGKEIARDRKCSFGDGIRLSIHTEKTVLTADGEEIAFLEITAEDKNGVTVENANNRVKVEVTGAGILVGLDNGDSTDYEPYQALSRRMFSGHLLAMVASGLKPGEIHVTASSIGLESATLTLFVEAGKKQIDSSDFMQGEFGSFYKNSDHIPSWGTLLPQNQPEHRRENRSEEEIPVRKLILQSSDGYLITPKRNGAVVEAVCCPANATYSDLEWRVINEMGMDVAFASLEKLNEQGSRVRITAIGDGIFQLRCGIRNGSQKVRTLSQIEMKAEGFGAFLVNPYEFISASLYQEGSKELGSGKDKGISTPYEGTVWMLFRHVDFGTFGAQTLQIPVFEFNGDPVNFTFWKGVPHQEGSVCIGSGIYQKPSIWDTYQEQTFQLTERIKGTCDFAIELSGKCNVKGFQFLRPEKGYEEISVLDNDGLYGDSFTLTDDAVTGIGNNVSLQFSDMDFKETGAHILWVYGRTPLDHNTIQVRFRKGEEEISVMVEFTHSEEYGWQRFEIEPVYGAQTVSFVFLPGCQFDFKAFRFEV